MVIFLRRMIARICTKTDPYDMDLRSGRHVVDAKSILGIFSLDWSKPVTMEIYSDDCDDLLAEIKPFLA